MPTTPPRPCHHTGCRALTTEGAYCDAHRTQHHTMQQRASRVSAEQARANNPALALAKQIRDSGHWQKVRKIILAQNPQCFDPFKFHGDKRPALSAHAHHITPLIEAPERAFEGENLAALCTQCHSRVEGMVRRGEPTKHLFATPNP